MLVSSCTTTSGTRSSLSPSALATIKTMAIIANQHEDFSVRLSREKSTATGAALFGLVGAGVEAGVRSSRDASLTNELRSRLGDYDLETTLAERLRTHMQAAGTFKSVLTIKKGELAASERQQFDSVLTVDIRQWGLRLCPGAASVDSVQGGLNVHSEMNVGESTKPVWERNELYLDAECHPIGDFRMQDTLLRDTLLRATDDFARRLVNEIVFP